MTKPPGAGLQAPWLAGRRVKGNGKASEQTLYQPQAGARSGGLTQFVQTGEDMGGRRLAVGQEEERPALQGRRQKT